MFKAELKLEAVKEILSDYFDLPLDKSYNLCYNSSSNQFILEEVVNGKARNEASSINSNSDSLDEDVKRGYDGEPYAGPCS